MEAPQTEYNSFNLNGLSHRNRKARLYELVRDFPAYVPYSERMHSVAAQTGVTPKILYQLAKRNGWQARLAAEIAAEQERAEYNARLEAAAPLAKDVSLLQIGDRIKGVAWTVLGASKRFIDVCSTMLGYYSDKIAIRIAEAGGIAHLDEAGAKDIERWQAKLSFYAKQLQPYATPSAISSLLSIIQFSERLPANDEAVQTEHFTIQALQAKLLTMGMGSAFDNPEAATSGFTSEPLPILDGWTNEAPNAPLSFELPPAADETQATA